MRHIHFTKLAGLLVLILGLTHLPTNTLGSKAQESRLQDAMAKRQQLLDLKLAQDRRQEELDRRIANFRKTKELLLKKDVPFDPDILMTSNWRKTLSPRFEQMPELQEVRIAPHKLKGVIDSREAVYARLLLWQDVNHNGRSDSGELRNLAQLGMNAISLDYQRSNRSDKYGNLFFYRSKIEVTKGSSLQHWAYDVFLVRGS